MSDPQDILAKMAGPLNFASRDDFAHLKLIRNLAATLQGLIVQLRKEYQEKALDSPDQHTFDETSNALEHLFVDYESQNETVKIDRIREASRLLVILDKSLVNPSCCSTNEDPPTENCSTSEENNLDLEQNFSRLALPVRFLKGVGPIMAGILARKDLHTIEDMLYFLPHRYEDRRGMKSIAMTQPGQRETIVGEVAQIDIKARGYRRQLEVLIRDDSGTMIAKWFRGSFAYLRKIFKIGERVILTGDVRPFLLGREMIHPDFEILDKTNDQDMLHFKRIVPVYSETQGLYQKTIRRLMKRLVDAYADALISPIPPDICRRQNLLDMTAAIRCCHFPDVDGDVGGLNEMRSPAQRRLIFDEFFFFQLGMALRHQGGLSEQGNPLKTGGPMLQTFFSRLPFQLTSAQKRVWEEISRDLSRPVAMNRLLQGDVGSGKTVIAMAALVLACQNGYQAAMMAPTEVLAAQHYRNIQQWLKPLGLRVALLTGSMKVRERQAVYEGIQRDDLSVVVGTHALIQESVSFHHLGVIVIDEQHRFGVVQRSSLRSKGLCPHVLVMTATPIPRTLAMTVYGDLDVSIIDELPPGKKPITTRIVTEGQRSVTYAIIGEELKKGHQVFIVYPLVEESETLDLKDASKMAEHLQQDVFPNHTIGLIHGRMKGSDKDAVMNRFISQEVHILVATTVIEVGIDVPGASLMVIEHAERFGLSQLHQLRGRVGRSDIPSSCLLMIGKGVSINARKRLRIMAETNDGFRIAEEDLAIRGPGEFMGTRQSGLPDFRVAHIVRDMGVLQKAKDEAFKLVSEDPSLSHPNHQALRQVLFHRWEGRLDLARTA